MTVSTYSADDLKYAKKGGFNRKKPSRKTSGTHAQVEARIVRWNDWCKDLKSAAVKGRALEKMKRQLKSAR